MHIRFWFKTVLYFCSPVRLGYMAKLAKYRKSARNIEEDDNVSKQFEGVGRITEQNNGLQYRHFESYEQYLKIQRHKFDRFVRLHGAFSRKLIFSIRVRFYSRFKMLPKWLSKDARIVCLGARQGTEVEVLRDIGFKNAYGVDVYPGPDNPFVRKGDFMRMDNEDSSVDLIYSNSIDHVYDLDQFYKEQARIIKPDGFVLFEFALHGSMGTYESVHWDDVDVPIKKLTEYFGEIVNTGTDEEWKWVLSKREKI